ncbi:MAG: hypothetical protein IT573_07005 [Deltaproteobacteria bacterium]|nr:hypothetical protein [Deltaproteobacteria bacterium]
MHATKLTIPRALGALILTLGAVSAQALEAPKMKYQGLDKNKDGVIIRQEWRGSSRSFRNQDWNNDGVLSGVELQVGAKRPGSSFETTYQARFEELDVNNDGIVVKAEWRGNVRDFYKLDDNGDKVLTLVEFSDREDERLDRFDNLDKNGDGIVSRGEWKESRELFERFDDNRDGALSRAELYRKRESGDRSFAALDDNRDGIISKTEWRGKSEEFKRIDVDSNGVITVLEYRQRDTVYRPVTK